MSKYEPSYGQEQQKPVLVPGEQIIWSGKPKKNAYIINKVLGMLPIALIWLAFDSVFIGAAFSGGLGGMSLFIALFMLLHLMPVWIWLGNALTANRSWKNTAYYVTNRRILIQTGVLSQDVQSIYYKEIENVNLRIGLLDRLLGVGDIYFDLGYYHSRGKTKTNYKAFLDIENAHEVYTRVQKVVMDIQSDMEFPNAYRPEENPGYNTTYKG